jgi:hypothetical protein
MARGALTPAELAPYARDGFVLARGLFDAREVEMLRRAAKEDKALDDHSFGRQDGEGGVVRLSLWNHPGDGIYGMFARCRSVVETCERILDDEVYHYHSKMIMKEARVGGAWAWHQDYGYWYQNGVLTPDLVSVFIAVDPATRENGCLQVLRGSHRCGRVDHVLAGDQAGADPERVAEIAKRLETVSVEMEPGDALFFHPNLLGPEPLGAPALGAHLLLQRQTQRPLQGVAPPALHPARQGRGCGHPRSGPEALRRGGRRGLARPGPRRERAEPRRQGAPLIGAGHSRRMAPPV